MISCSISEYQLTASRHYNRVCKTRCAMLKVTYLLIMNLLTRIFQALFTWQFRTHEKSKCGNCLIIQVFIEFHNGFWCWIINLDFERERSSDDGFPTLLLSPPKGVDLLPYPTAEVLGLNDQVRHSKGTRPLGPRLEPERRSWIVHGSQFGNGAPWVQKWQWGKQGWGPRPRRAREKAEELGTMKWGKNSKEWGVRTGRSEQVCEVDWLIAFLSVTIFTKLHYVREAWGELFVGPIWGKQVWQLRLLEAHGLSVSLCFRHCLAAAGSQFLSRWVCSCHALRQKSGSPGQAALKWGPRVASEQVL